MRHYYLAFSGISMTATSPTRASSPGGSTPTVGSPTGKRLVYLCLQQTVEGQASHAHVHEIIAGLERRGWIVDLREIRADRSRRRSKLYFLWHYLKPQLTLWVGRSTRPDALYIRADALAIVAFLWARFKRIPVVQEVNGPHGDRLVSKRWLRPIAPVLAGLQRYQFRRSDALIAVTPRLGQWLEREAPGRAITVIPNGANTALFHPAARTTIATPPRYVILVGLLAQWQGVPLLLAAISDPEWPRDVSLLIAGDGDERPRVEAAARTNDRIRYLGTIPYREVPGLVARSLAGLSLKIEVAGRTETGMSPLKLYETLACGVPAIVTEYHGQSDVVREYDCGLVIPQNDPTALARAVAHVAAHETERVEWGRRGLEAVRTHASWDQRAEATETLLRRLVQ